MLGRDKEKDLILSSVSEERWPNTNATIISKA